MSAPPMSPASGSEAWCVDTSRDSPCTIRLLEDTQTNSSGSGHRRSRKPDLSTRIHVHFPGEMCKEYIGTYVGHGLSKTVFVLSAAPAEGRFEGCVLKVAKLVDPEPYVFKQFQGIGPEVLHVTWALVGSVWYYCWICEPECAAEHDEAMPPATQSSAPTVTDDAAGHAETAGLDDPADEHDVPIVQVAFKNNTWWSLPKDVSALIYVGCLAGRESGYTYDWGPPGTFARYTIDFASLIHTNLESGRKRPVRIAWVREQDISAACTGALPDPR